MKLLTRLILLSLLLIFFGIFLLIWIPFYTTHVSLLFTNEWEQRQIKSISRTNSSSSHIPPILHQTWKDSQIPDKWLKPYEMCQNNLKNYKRILWTDAKAEAFIQSEYPWFLSTYKSYPYKIQRADAIRYFVLYHYGGFYLDLDIGCRKDFDSLMHGRVILAKTNPIGFSNDWMASEPKHPFFKFLITELPKWNMDLFFNYPTVFFSTGPMFLNMMYCKWNQENVLGFDQISVLPEKYYSGREYESFVKHFDGSSWHSWDARIILWVWDHIQWVLTSCLFIIVFLICICKSRRSPIPYQNVSDDYVV